MAKPASGVGASGAGAGDAVGGRSRGGRKPIRPEERLTSDCYVIATLAPESRAAFDELLTRERLQMSTLIRAWIADFVADRPHRLPVAEYGAPWPGQSSHPPTSRFSFNILKPESDAFKAKCKAMGAPQTVVVRAWVEAFIDSRRRKGALRAPAASPTNEPLSKLQLTVSAPLKAEFVERCRVDGLVPSSVTGGWLEAFAKGDGECLPPLAALLRSEAAAAVLRSIDPRRGSERQGARVKLQVRIQRSIWDAARAGAEMQGRELHALMSLWMAAFIHAQGRPAMAGGAARKTAGKPLFNEHVGVAAPRPGAADGGAMRPGAHSVATGPAGKATLNVAIPRALREAFEARCAMEGRTKSRVVAAWLRAFNSGDHAGLPKIKGGVVALSRPGEVEFDAQVSALVPKADLQPFIEGAIAQGSDASKMLRQWIEAFVGADMLSDLGAQAKRSALQVVGRHKVRSVRRVGSPPRQVEVVAGTPKGKPDHANCTVQVRLPPAVANAWRAKTAAEGEGLSERARRWIEAFIKDGGSVRMSIQRDQRDSPPLGVNMKVGLRKRFQAKCADLSTDPAKMLRAWIEADLDGESAWCAPARKTKEQKE